MKEKKIANYWLIFGGVILGIVMGWVAVSLSAELFIKSWVTPFGDIFIRLLELIALPLLFVSLIKGIIGLQDSSRLFTLGWRTISLYMLTTTLTVVLGVLLVTIIKPGEMIPQEASHEYFGEFAEQVDTTLKSADELSYRSPLAPIVEMIPRNAVGTLAGHNSTMLQALVLAILLGVAIVTMKGEQVNSFRKFILDVDLILSRCIDMVMSIAPIGIMALMANVVVDSKGDAVLLSALGLYVLTAMIGFALVAFVLYPLMIGLFTRISVRDYLKAVLPVQLMAISTSSSAATLPTTMKVSNDELNIPRSVTSFTLPIGVTINMDGSSIYLSVTVIFIAQAMNIDLSWAHYAIIVFTGILASIGTPGVPGGVLVTLVMVLSTVGIPAEGLALVLALVRPLDMFVTAVNVTGDIAVSALVAEQIGEGESSTEK